MTLSVTRVRAQDAARSAPALVGVDPSGCGDLTGTYVVGLIAAAGAAPIEGGGG